ncbi:DUF881 domain-containing protein [Natronosporangium hydrolyticum]|uniref:DUF881 domain-containing protein n=1 Tax=Natronosporangium hydrolyticum TaxID=2811111 RepID=A0A895YB94_9ACTN|nr:DUF881 domain-containing protein [Natronosporangium hydrolyticum]QSB12599.1 DUF881 domain-containing protein [Natronosporangium hydrolyticum]
MTEPRNPYRPLSPDFLTELFREPLDSGYAEAAARRAAGGSRPPGRRGGRLITVLTLAVVGALLAVAYQQVVAEQPSRAQVRADLETQIRDRQDETQVLQDRADTLRDEVAALRDQQLGDPAAVRTLRELEAVAGLGRVHGDGVVVRVDDGPASVDPQTGEQVVDPQARILYRDLQDLANALWAAGAEGVAINGRRLTATSTIRSASGAILIDRTPVAGPYEVVAVGPDDLGDRFAATQAAALMELLVQEFGIEYEVRSDSDLTLPAAAEPQLRFATVLDP